jgi:hypothetical protein
MVETSEGEAQLLVQPVLGLGAVRPSVEQYDALANTACPSKIAEITVTGSSWKFRPAGFVLEGRKSGNARRQ